MTKQYGRRPGLSAVDTGARRVATTYGKEAFHTYGPKSQGHLVVEQDAERLISHMLGLDPSVISYRTQPFTVDLVSAAVLYTEEQRLRARARHKGKRGAIFYTPDYAARLSGDVEHILEVKLDAYLGDEAYQDKLSLAKSILWDHGYKLSRVVVPMSAKHPLRINVPLLHQASLRSDLRPDDEVFARVEQLAQHGAQTVGEFCAGLGVGVSMTPVLLASGVLSMDLASNPIRRDAPAQPAYGSLDHLQLLRGLSR